MCGGGGGCITDRNMTIVEITETTKYLVINDYNLPWPKHTTSTNIPKIWMKQCNQTKETARNPWRRWLNIHQPVLLDSRSRRPPVIGCRYKLTCPWNDYTVTIHFYIHLWRPHGMSLPWSTYIHKKNRKFSASMHPLWWRHPVMTSTSVDVLPRHDAHVSFIRHRRCISAMCSSVSVIRLSLHFFTAGVAYGTH